MSESKQIAVAEQPQQLITIEPTKYVELVFEPFAKQYADAVDAVREVAYDIKTTAGMAVAIKHRAVFRDIRVASEKARKLRKAPILEIGKLLDSRQGEIESTLLPLETLFDEEIKAEEKRKDDEKIARALAESARITAIRKRIAETQAIPSMLVGKSSETIAAAIESLEAVEITLEDWAEFSGEAEMTKLAALDKLKEMHTAQLASEQAAAEAARQAEADRIERERVAEANRIEAKRLADLAAELERQAQEARDKQAEADRVAREQREATEAEQRAASERAAAAMRQQQAEHERRMAAERADFARQQAEMAAKQQALREATEKLAHEQREREEAAAATAKLEADHAEAFIENARIDAQRAAAMERQRVPEAELAEAVRQLEARKAAEAEAARRVRVQFELNGPGDVEIVRTLAQHYDVTVGDVMGWMKKFDYTAADEQLAAENVAANHLEKAA